MYHQRLKTFIFLCIGGLLITVGRLVILQTFKVQQTRQAVERLRILPPEQRPTIRGKILDRYERPIALDEPVFYLQINYQLTRYLDERWQQAWIQRQISENETRSEVQQRLFEKWKEPTKQLKLAIELAAFLADVSTDEIEQTISDINDHIWEMGRRVWWRRRNRGASWDEYFAICDTIDPEKVVGIDLYEMHKSYPLIELKNEQDLIRAQLALIHLEGLEIKAQAKRSYPYGSAASQLIGWVGPAIQSDRSLFEDDEYMYYLPGEVLGKAGIERTYEPVLRGRRGMVLYDKDGNLLERKEPEYGKNVRLTIDIDLQRKIENLLADPTQNHRGKPSAAVVLEAARNEILAIASHPTFDLNTIREYTYYNRIYNDPNYIRFAHRALEKVYPPGSTAKPIIMIAGLEEKKTWPEEVISCSCYDIPKGSWPRCIMQWKFHTCHDIMWENNGRNAIRGSCNVYFSRLANRLDREDLQQWFYRFGYGQKVLPTPLVKNVSDNTSLIGKIPQAHGSVIYGIQRDPIDDIHDIPIIPSSKNSEKRQWGIGQGNLRATVLQVANVLSVIVRNGVYKSPRLIYDDSDPFNDSGRRQIPVSSKTLSIVRDGMHAVINESGGTAFKEFNVHHKSVLFDRDMTLYGKTGSTTNPDHAWFEAFAEDETGRSLVVAVLVEDGQSGAGEAAPLGRLILRVCNEAGYIGTKPTAELPADSAN